MIIWCKAPQLIITFADDGTRGSDVNAYGNRCDQIYNHMAICAIIINQFLGQINEKYYAGCTNRNNEVSINRPLFGRTRLAHSLWMENESFPGISVRYEGSHELKVYHILIEYNFLKTIRGCSFPLANLMQLFNFISSKIILSMIKVFMITLILSCTLDICLKYLVSSLMLGFGVPAGGSGTSHKPCLHTDFFLYEWSDCTFNSPRPTQNGRHFADHIFKCILLNANVWITIKNSLKFVPKGLTNNIPALFQIMASRCPGDKPLSEPNLTYICVTRPQWVKLTVFQMVTARLCFYSALLLHNVDNCFTPPVLPVLSLSMALHFFSNIKCNQFPEDLIVIYAWHSISWNSISA